ncbi:hypothetical protein GE061_014719 [Apolygus lucorum]|uniref:Uncharacterized protein n=1 Tax=Apolygus lucorum TaxID=248454 RepID=A0A6A4JAN5_APOLU|nr:hypothetical protein GE061_014719 [Apolygus lucorum]
MQRDGRGRGKSEPIAIAHLRSRFPLAWVHCHSSSSTPPPRATTPPRHSDIPTSPRRVKNAAFREEEVWRNRDRPVWRGEEGKAGRHVCEYVPVEVR